MEYCRVCLKKSDSLESFTAEYRELFFQVTTVYIDESEKEFICPECLKRLLHAHEFRLDAIKADLWFREQVFLKQCETETVQVQIEIKRPKRRKRRLKHKPKKKKVVRFYICDKCGDQFRKKEEISRHMRNQHILREFICEESNCGKQFNLLRIYQKHIQNHLTESTKAWICEYCAKSFSTKYKLTLHLRSHTNIRPYKCCQCTASFKQQTDLNTHLKSLHSNDRPFTCTDCGQSFKIPNSLRSHRKRKHNQEGMLTCSECHKKVMCSAELKEHVAIYHRGERNHACKFCSKTYTKAYHLRRHLHDNHYDLYTKLIESGELRTVNRCPNKVETKVEIVETQQEEPNMNSNYTGEAMLVINY